MSKQDTCLTRDAVAEWAARALDRCVIGPSEVPEDRRDFVVDLVTVLLRAGLPACDLRAVERGEEATGAMLAAPPDRPTLPCGSSGVSTVPSAR
ncbi:hypothetical protein ACFV2U_17435 [Streptomyces sp. NPDC059697]|uniref:hypothetical protein n=1 Tax=Streptomyces sp. NPDC059697 TaxID=3346912 RepID=UPI0036C6C5B2